MNAKMPGSTRQRAGLLAGVLAVIGIVLIVVAACTSRPGPPQPTSAQAADPVSAAATASADPTSTPPSVSERSVSSPATTPAPTSPRQPTPSSRTAAPSSSPAPTSRSTTPKSSTVAPTPLLLPASMPTKLSIPSIGVSSDLLKLGLNPDGTVQVQSLDDPDSKAGWFDQSPEPGTIGPSVLLGHVDSKKYGPGVFYQLGALAKGAEVDVTRADGTVAVFRVDSVESYAKDAFPTATVYHDLTYAGLRLITCGGTFDPAKGSYESNIVAFATLVSVHRS
jgi:sortase (surface protein transpeptidase)